MLTLTASNAWSSFVAKITTRTLWAAHAITSVFAWASLWTTLSWFTVQSIFSIFAYSTWSALFAPWSLELDPVARICVTVGQFGGPESLFCDVHGFMPINRRFVENIVSCVVQCSNAKDFQFQTDAIVTFLSGDPTGTRSTRRSFLAPVSRSSVFAIRSTFPIASRAAALAWDAFGPTLSWCAFQSTLTLLTTQTYRSLDSCWANRSR